MEATYILLGRPWKFDRKPFHDGHANKFTFSFQGKKITLLPLSPREVNEDQLQMIKKRKEEKAQKKAQGHESKKSMITLKGVKKVMLAQKPIFLAYPSEFSPSFQNPQSKHHPRQSRIFYLSVSLSTQVEGHLDHSIYRAFE